MLRKDDILFGAERCSSMSVILECANMQRVASAKLTGIDFSSD